MATYKVIQDIEAEDKLVGPLSLRQFMYAIIVVAIGFVAFQLAKVQIMLAMPMLPPLILFGFLAAPISKDQPSEIWLYSRIRFFLKPRKRIWDQAGLKELVTITVPKRDETQYSDNLSQGEVKSRLRALADTIDSRGWVIKNVNLGLMDQSTLPGAGSDRLIQPAAIPQTVSAFADIQPADDILDIQSNPIAQQFDQMINASSEAHREELMQKIREAASRPASAQQSTPPADYWFMSNPSQPQAVPRGYATFQTTPPVAPGNQTATQSTTLTPDEQALLTKVHNQEERMDTALGHAEPPKAPKSSPPPQAQQPSSPPASSVTQTPDPAILELAKNDDLNVATIARQANKAQGQNDEGEVVISLR